MESSESSSNHNTMSSQSRSQGSEKLTTALEINEEVQREFNTQTETAVQLPGQLRSDLPSATAALEAPGLSPAPAPAPTLSSSSLASGPTVTSLHQGHDNNIVLPNGDKNHQINHGNTVTNVSVSVKKTERGRNSYGSNQTIASTLSGGVGGCGDMDEDVDGGMDVDDIAIEVLPTMALSTANNEIPHPQQNEVQGGHASHGETDVIHGDEIKIQVNLEEKEQEQDQRHGRLRSIDLATTKATPLLARRVSSGGETNDKADAGIFTNTKLRTSNELHSATGGICTKNIDSSSDAGLIPSPSKSPLPDNYYVTDPSKMLGVKAESTAETRAVSMEVMLKNANCHETSMEGSHQQQILENDESDLGTLIVEGAPTSTSISMPMVLQNRPESQLSPSKTGNKNSNNVQPQHASTNGSRQGTGSGSGSGPKDVSIQDTDIKPMPSEVDINNATTIDSILNSPRPKDEIVEKSPGGRYVRFSERLGSGAYKNVYKAYDTSEGIEVAWNVVNLTGVPKTERQYIVNEVRLLEKLNHANIISFHGSWVNRELEQVIFVTEILSSGTLKSFVNKVQIIRYKIAKRWAIQILKGLDYLHSQDPPIIHRDLKCDNIFINGPSGDLRIGDLGLSTVITKSKVLSVLGTPEFMAPELYDELYDEKVDIYAFGMCMLEIFTKELPYQECSNPAQIYKKVTIGVEPQSLKRIRSSNARDFIRQCLGTKDEKGNIVRPSASELMRHPFLEKREDDGSQVEVDSEDASRESNICATGNPQPNADLPRHTSAGSGPDQIPGLDQNAMSSPSPMGNGAGVSESIQIATGTLHQTQATEEAQQIPQLPMLASQKPKSDVPLNGTMRDTQKKQTQKQGQPLQPKTLAQPVEISSIDYDGMPDSESNMKPVYVSMGRGQKVDASNEHDHLPIPIKSEVPLQAATGPSPASISPSQHPPVDYQHAVSGRGAVVSNDYATRKRSFDSTESRKPPFDAKLKYLRMAAIIDDNNSGVVFPNDIMQLRITLTVDVEEQHVQFGFHLVEDDAVQVAKEMVTELNLPSDAILEISESISAVARDARIKQDHYKQMMQQGVPHSLPASTIANISNRFVAQNTGAPQFHPAIASNAENPLEHSMESVSSLTYEQQVVANPVIDSLPPASMFPPVGYDHQVGTATINDSLPQASVVQLNSRYPQNSQSKVTALTIPSASRTNGPMNSQYYPAPVKKSTSGESSTTQAPSQGMNSSQPTANSVSAPVSTIPLPAIHLASDHPPIPLESALEFHDRDGGEMVELSNAELKQLKEEHEKKKKRAQKVFSNRMNALQKSREEKEAQHLKTLEKHEKERAALEERLKKAEEEQQERLEKMDQEFVQQAIAMRSNPNPLLESSENENAALENRLSNVNLKTMETESISGVNKNLDSVVKAPSPSTLSQDESADSR